MNLAMVTRFIPPTMVIVEGEGGYWWLQQWAVTGRDSGDGRRVVAGAREGRQYPAQIEQKQGKERGLAPVTVEAPSTAQRWRRHGRRCWAVGSGRLAVAGDDNGKREGVTGRGLHGQVESKRQGMGWMGRVFFFFYLLI